MVQDFSHQAVCLEVQESQENFVLVKDRGFLADDLLQVRDDLLQVRDGGYSHPYLGKIPILTSIFFKWVETTN